MKHTSSPTTSDQCLFVETSETFDDPTAIRQYRQRVLAYEEIGLAVFDEKRILKVTIS